MIEVVINRETCRGYGNCALVAEGLFDVDDQGRVVLLENHLADHRLAEVQRAAYDCPTGSITYVERPDDRDVEGG